MELEDEWSIFPTSTDEFPDQSGIFNSWSESIGFESNQLHESPFPVAQLVPAASYPSFEADLVEYSTPPYDQGLYFHEELGYIPLAYETTTATRNELKPNSKASSELPLTLTTTKSSVRNQCEPKIVVKSGCPSYRMRLSEEIEWVCDQLQLSSAVQQCALYTLTRYFHAVVSVSGRGPSHGGEKRSSVGVSPTAAALVYLACRQQRVPRSFRELSHTLRLTTRSVFQRLQKVNRILQQTFGTSMERIKASQFLPRFCAALNLPFAVEKKARKILDTSRQNTCAVVAAASAILGAVGIWPPNQGQILLLSLISGISQATLRKSCRQLLNSSAEIV